MTQIERDQNLMVVAAIVGYANKHRIPAAEAFDILSRHEIPSLIRRNYATLHTQSLEESLSFAEDIMARESV